MGDKRRRRRQRGKRRSGFIWRQKDAQSDHADRVVPIEDAPEEFGRME